MRQNSSPSFSNLPAVRFLVPLLIALLAVAALLGGASALNGSQPGPGSAPHQLADVGWNASPAPTPTH